MFKIQIAPDRIFDLINTGSATMWETLMIEKTGYTLTEWDAGYARLMEVILDPEKKMTVEDLFNDGAFLKSIAISVWIARIRSGEEIGFDASLKDWSFSNLKFIPPEISEFIKSGADALDPKKPVRTRKGSGPAKKSPATMVVKGSGQKA
jgi:hypothetical protein